MSAAGTKANGRAPAARLSLGPCLFNWHADTWRDFYYRIADEAPVDIVHVGEVVCSKRAPFFTEHIPAVIERLQAAGKEVVLSTPQLVTTDRERRGVSELVADAEMLLEANDMGAVALLAGRPHVIGPLVNVYSEGALAWMARQGAVRVALPYELAREAVAAIAGAGRANGVDVEVQVFGRMPLAISARCYHARAHGLHKDNCQFVCNQDADGMAVGTLDGERFLAVNGLQTMSHAYNLLLPELPEMQEMGVNVFRLSPHSCDMVRVAALYRDVLEGRAEAAAARDEIAGMVGADNVANGFYQGREGAAAVAS